MKFGIYIGNDSKMEFAALLMSKGITASAVYCDDFQKCVEAAVRLGCGVCYSVGELALESDVVVISTSDENIRKSVLKLARVDMSEKTVCVESSCTASMALMDIEAAAHMSVHVPDGKSVYVEGSGRPYREIKNYFENIGIKVNEISADAKVNYDLSMFFSQSGISTMIEAAREMMGSIGGDEKFNDIIRANVEKCLEERSVTGVVPDYDISAIRRHVGSLGGNNEALYKTIVLKAVELSGLSNDEKERIKYIIIGS